MKAITIKAPWTVPILLNVKTVENRSQATHHRGTLAIHVSRTWSPVAAADSRVYAASHQAGVDRRLCELATTPGAVVALAELADCHRATGRCCPEWGDPQGWHLMLRRVTPLAYPVPARGALGVWTPAPALAAAITNAASSVEGCRG